MVNILLTLEKETTIVGLAGEGYMRIASTPQEIRLQTGVTQRETIMSVYSLSVPASPTLRSLIGFGLLVITAIMFLLVVEFELQLEALPTDLAMLKTYGCALLLGAAVMFDIAWFSAVVRTQAAEGQKHGAEMTGDRA